LPFAPLPFDADLDLILTFLLLPILLLGLSAFLREVFDFFRAKALRRSGFIFDFFSAELFFLPPKILEKIFPPKTGKKLPEPRSKTEHIMGKPRPDNRF
jgi:hypothetical protein